MRPASTTEVCTAPPARNRIVGAPWMPVAASWPWSRSTVSRATISALRFALVAPVTNPTPLSPGSPRIFSSQLAATSSTAAVAGVGWRDPVFWSHARDEPVGGQCRRVRAADDEAVEARGAHRHQARAGSCRQFVDHLVGCQTLLGQDRDEPFQHAVDIQLGPDGPLVRPSPATPSRTAARHPTPARTRPPARRLGRSPCRWSSRHLRGSDPPARRRHPQGHPPAERLRRGRAGR